jgi:hypothetical protein
MRVGRALRLLVGFVVFVTLMILAVFGTIYLAPLSSVTSPSPSTPGHTVLQPGDWCGTAAGQGPDGIDAVLCVSAKTSRFVLVTRPSMYTNHREDDDCLVQRGHVDAIQSWARSDNVAYGNEVYAFFTTGGISNTSMNCRFALSMIGTSLTFVPMELDRPVHAHSLLSVRNSACPPGMDCGSGLYGFFRQASMLQIPQWYGVYMDSILSVAINFRGPSFSQYTLAITRGDDVQLCHGRRTDLPDMESFDGTLKLVDLSTAFPIVSGARHLVFMHVAPEELPPPSQSTSDVTSFVESDRVLRALLSLQRSTTTVSDRRIIGLSLEEIVFII